MPAEPSSGEVRQAAWSSLPLSPSVLGQWPPWASLTWVTGAAASCRHADVVPPCVGCLFQWQLPEPEREPEPADPAERLHDAADRGDAAAVARLLGGPRPPNVNARDGHGVTALMWAARSGSVDTVRAVLAKRNSLTLGAKDAGSHTALMYAAVNGHEAVVQELLAAGTDAKARDERGNSALVEAAREGHIGVVRVLLAHQSTSGIQPIIYKRAIWATKSPAISALLQVSYFTQPINRRAQASSLLSVKSSGLDVSQAGRSPATVAPSSASAIPDVRDLRLR
jgi:hypothetical protein